MNKIHEMVIRVIDLAEKQRTIDIIEYFNRQDDEHIAREIEKVFMNEAEE